MVFFNLVIMPPPIIPQAVESPELLHEAAAAGVRILFLPPNTTLKLQPLDVGYFNTLREKVEEIVGHLTLAGMKSLKRHRLPNIIYEATQRMSSGSVSAGFRNSGIFPFDQSKVKAFRTNDDITSHLYEDVSETPPAATPPSLCTLCKMGIEPHPLVAAGAIPERLASILLMPKSLPTKPHANKRTCKVVALGELPQAYIPPREFLDIPVEINPIQQTTPQQTTPQQTTPQQTAPQQTTLPKTVPTASQQTAPQQTTLPKTVPTASQQTAPQQTTLPKTVPTASKQTAPQQPYRIIYQHQQTSTFNTALTPKQTKNTIIVAADIHSTPKEHTHTTITPVPVKALSSLTQNFKCTHPSHLSHCTQHIFPFSCEGGVSCKHIKHFCFFFSCLTFFWEPDGFGVGCLRLLWRFDGWCLVCSTLGFWGEVAFGVSVSCVVLMLDC